MFGIRFVKTRPTTYVFHHRAGKIRREGVGLSFFCYGPTSTLILVPIANAELPFVFHETTADFQEVTIQGQLSYRIADPGRLVKLLDYSVDPHGRYRSEDPDVLRQRLVHTVQVLTRGLVQKMPLREVLLGSDGIGSTIQAQLEDHSSLGRLGVEALGLDLLSLRPDAEMAKALEAEYREAFQQNADAAIYERRYAAVEEERRIKENELNTEIAVEEKKRLIREKKVAADIAVEARRAEWIGQKVENDKKSADSQAYALEAQISPLRDLDWKKLMALASGGGDPKLMIALAFRELAENADKIGQLNVTPDLLGSLLGQTTKEG